MFSSNLGRLLLDIAPSMAGQMIIMIQQSVNARLLANKGLGLLLSFKEQL